MMWGNGAHRVMLQVQRGMEVVLHQSSGFPPMFYTESVEQRKSPTSQPWYFSLCSTRTCRTLCRKSGASLVHVETVLGLGSQTSYRRGRISIQNTLNIKLQISILQRLSFIDSTPTVSYNHNVQQHISRKQQ